MKKALITSLFVTYSLFLFGQKKAELTQNQFMVDVLDFGKLCGYNNPITKRYMHVNKDTALFEMYCDRAYGASCFITLIDVNKNKLLKSKKVSDSYKDVLGGYGLRNNHLIKVKTGKFNKIGDDISVLEIDLNNLEEKELFNTNTYFPEGIKGFNLFNCNVTIEYLFDSNILLGSYSKPEEKRVKRNGSTYVDKVWVSTAFIVDCKNKKVKEFDNCFFSYQAGTTHPYKFFDNEKNGNAFVYACKTYQIPDFAKMSLSEDMSYDNAAYETIKKNEKNGLLTSNIPNNIGYIIQEEKNGNPLTYYAMRPPSFSANELKQQLNALRTLVQSGKTQYKPLVNRTLLEYNRKKEYPLYYLPEENKFLCRDSSSIKKGIDMPDVVNDLNKNNKTINDYNAQSVRAFRNELKPDYTIIPLEKKLSLAGKENKNRIKAFNYSNDEYKKLALVYSDFVTFSDSTGFFFSPIKNCRSAYLIENENLILSNDTRCVVISLSKKSIIMDIDLEKINSSYTPYYLNLSGGGRYLAIYNNMMNFTTIVQLFPFKILENIPTMENITAIAVSDNGEKVIIEHGIGNTSEALQFNRITNESKMLDISLYYYTDDLSYILFNRGSGKLLVYSAKENVTKGFSVFSSYQNYNRVFKLSDDKLLLNDGDILSWSEGIVYTPNFDIGDNKFSTTGYDRKTNSILSHENDRLGICTFYEINDNYTSIKRGNDKYNLMPSDEAILITNQRNEAWKKKYEEERKRMEDQAKEQAVTDALKAEMVCDACFGDPISKTGKCSYNRCRNGYVYGETNTMRYDDKGYVEYKNTKTTGKCYLCKGTGYWVCEKCEGTGLAKKKRRK